MKLVKALSILVCLCSVHAATGAESSEEFGYVKTELYFGLSKKGGGQVSADEWQEFLAATITPAFKEGLTVVNGYGQYLNDSGKLAKEPSKVVILIHVPTRAKSAEIDQIIDAYKKLYQQESVLRTTTPLTVSFGNDELSALKLSKQESRAPLEEYSQYNDSERENTPAGYIGYLKKSRFKNGDLDRLPRFAIILEVADVRAFLVPLEDAEFTNAKPIELGSASPNVLYVVTRKTGASLIINRGLPGGGGVQTQAAELSALGVQYVVHIGTCGLLNGTLDEKTVILSDGSYKDGAAVMLSNAERGKINPLSQPDAELKALLLAQLKTDRVAFTGGIGYTIPIYYYQPSGLIRSLVAGAGYPKDARPLFLEMEEACLFETANLSKIKAASMVVTADRYLIVDGKLTHDFPGDPRPALVKGFREAVKVFDALNAAAK